MQANGHDSDVSPRSQSSPFRPRRLLAPDLKVSVIIPCYNEEEMLPLLFKNLNAGASQWGLDYEVILVDDGSSDGTWERCINSINSIRAGRCSRCRAISAIRSPSGPAYAPPVAALSPSSTPICRNPPEILPAFFKKWEEGI